MSTSSQSASKSALPPGLQWAKQSAYWMDNAIPIPFTSFRFGLDPLLSLHPLAGDIVSVVFLVIFIGLAIRYKLPKTLILKMAVNCAIDALIGLVPMLGDIVDAAFKSTAMNANLLEEAYLAKEASRWPFDKNKGQGPVIDTEATIAH